MQNSFHWQFIYWENFNHKKICQEDLCSNLQVHNYRFTTNQCFPLKKKVIYFRATIGADFLAKVVKWNENLTLRLQLWDIAGQDRFSLLSRSFYKDAAGAFIVSDLSRAETLDAVISWKEELDNKVRMADGSKLPCFLLANKVLFKNTLFAFTIYDQLINMFTV